MQNAASSNNGSKLTQLTAVNVAKVLSIACLVIYAVIFGISDLRQVLYLCLHISYCLWWLLEQWLYPQRRQQLFSEPTGIGGFIFTLLFIGVLYTLPGYLAFTNFEPLSSTAVAVALPIYIFGSLINTSADVQKLTAKQWGANLVKDGIWRFARNINYFGDLMRYVSFAVLAGSPWAYLVPGVIFLLYLQRAIQKDQAMAEKYPDYAEYRESSNRLIPFIW